MKFLIRCWIIVFCTLTMCAVKHAMDTDVGLSAQEIIVKYGYPFETFTNVITQDGYLLDVYRIPHGISKTNDISRPVVLLMHGLSGSAHDYVVMGPQSGLSYLLADRGYDVWLGNARGNKYSRKHRLLNPDFDAKFWDFTWHEIGVYDLPAIFALIRNVTKKQEIAYIGMSQGTTIFYVCTAMIPECNNNITIMISLAPVAYMKYLYTPSFRFLARYETILTPLAKLLGINEAPPPPITRLLIWANRILCPLEGFFQDICASILFFTGGYDPAQLNKSAIAAIFGEGPSGSTRQFLHYAQNINSGEFRQFNFGRSINLRKYGSVQPPSYNISKITTPVALYHAEGDWLAQPKDVERLHRELPNCVYKYVIPYAAFNHYDFIFSIDVVKLVYDNMFEILDKYNKNIT